VKHLDPNSIVFYLNHDSTRLSEESQVDSAAGWSVFAGIVEQIPDSLLQQLWIST